MTHRTAWERMPEHVRKTIVWGLWFTTWIGLLAGLFDRRFYEVVVAFSVAHAFTVLLLHGFQVAAFPVQVRLAYVLWVAIGTYVPHMTFLMYITTLGLVGNLFFKYCPLARMLYLLPWNRMERFSFGLLARVFLSPPVDGRFRPVPAGGMSWETKHSVVADANRQTVWEFHSNVDNVARVEGDGVSMTLDGPFEAGTKGTTEIEAQDPTHWRLVEVIPPERSVTEMELTEAVVRTTWTFEKLPGDRTRLSQHMVLEGPGAEAYVSVMEELFAGNIRKGMEKIAEEIAKYAAGQR